MPIDFDILTMKQYEQILLECVKFTTTTTIFISMVIHITTAIKTITVINISPRKCLSAKTKSKA